MMCFWYYQVVESINSHGFKHHMQVEVVDKMCVSAMRVARVEEIIGGRLRLQYSDTKVCIKICILAFR